MILVLSSCVLGVVPSWQHCRLGNALWLRRPDARLAFSQGAESNQS